MSAVQPPVQAVEKAEVKMNRISRFRLLIALLVAAIALAPLALGNFSVSLPLIPQPGRHVQYGFQMKGVNVWVTDVGPYGNVQVTAIPEPASLGAIALLTLVRRRR